MTGKRAESILKEALREWEREQKGKGERHECEVLTQNIGIAAFTTPRTLKRALERRFTANPHTYTRTYTHTHTKTRNAHANAHARSQCELRKCLAGYDMILVSGLCKADFSELERELGIPIRLGPKNARDIGEVLKHASEIEFSASVPADIFLSEKRRENALKEVASFERAASASFSVKGVKIGGDSRMKVCAEIVDATLLSEEEVQKRMQYFLESGADWIDIGVHVSAKEKDVERAVSAALKCDASVPISVDTLDPELLLAGVSAGADIVLSLNSENMHIVEKIADAGVSAAVVVPDFQALREEEVGERGREEKGTREARILNSLFANLRSAADAGIKNLIADPVLNALGYGFTASLKNYILFRERDKKTPLFFGVGNVTELLDADSIGVNALLAGIASELNASVLFTPEHSDKCVGCVSELRRAAEMMLLAKKRKTTPKDLGIDLLVLKEKRRRRPRILKTAAEEAMKAEDANVVVAKESETWRPDPLGSFRIELCETPAGSRILATHSSLTKQAEQTKQTKQTKEGKEGKERKETKIVGRNAKEVLDTILRLGLVSSLEHAAYLGRELAKAEIALSLKKSYEQDEPLFKSLLH
ncbi:MAG: Dihydropteroate synthase [Methanophagales archaeon]|nr:Dihydropteroate synthase [Methanophagales archaeon]